MVNVYLKPMGIDKGRIYKPEGCEIAGARRVSKRRGGAGTGHVSRMDLVKFRTWSRCGAHHRSVHACV